MCDPVWLPNLGQPSYWVYWQRGKVLTWIIFCWIAVFIPYTMVPNSKWIGHFQGCLKSILSWGCHVTMLQVLQFRVLLLFPDLTSLRKLCIIDHRLTVSKKMLVIPTLLTQFFRNVLGASVSRVQLACELALTRRSWHYFVKLPCCRSILSFPLHCGQTFSWVKY